MFWLEFWKERMQSKVVVELVAEEKKKKESTHISSLIYWKKMCYARNVVTVVHTHALLFLAIHPNK